MATAGFSTHDASIGYFHSPLIDLLSMFFMFLAGANFSLHFVAFRNVDARVYWRDPEFMAYLKYVLALIATVTIYLFVAGTYPTLSKSFVQGGFQVVSYVTSTGFTTANASVWPGFLPLLLIMSVVIGGCGGSTAGGIKVIRAYLLFKQSARELARLVHPNAEIPVKLGGRPVAPRVLDSIWAFFASYVALFTLMVFILMATGLNGLTAFSAVDTCINNMGPGLGAVAANFQGVNEAAKWVLIFAMLLGRLEIFTLLVLVTPAFWRR
jgi:trk system potassium uptake protein TrkH